MQLGSSRHFRRPVRRKVGPHKRASSYVVVQHESRHSPSLQPPRSGVHNSENCRIGIETKQQLQFRESIMTRIARRIMVMLSVAGALASAPGYSGEPSSHVLADAVTGKIKPAKITAQPAPN